jgi:predicted RNA-binding protein with PUA-like domain
MSQPGIVGICEVAREAYPDSTALDPNSKKYDEKSSAEDPRWYMVDVRLVSPPLWLSMPCYNMQQLISCIVSLPLW